MTLLLPAAPSKSVTSFTFLAEDSPDRSLAVAVDLRRVAAGETDRRPADFGRAADDGAGLFARGFARPPGSDKRHTQHTHTLHKPIHSHLWAGGTRGCELVARCQDAPSWTVGIALKLVTVTARH